MDRLGLAELYFPDEPNERPKAEYRTYTAASDSEDGIVLVQVGDEVMEVPVVGSVSEGDDVSCLYQNHTLKGIGTNGWGDALELKVDSITAGTVTADDIRAIQAQIDVLTTGSLFVGSLARYVQITDESITIGDSTAPTKLRLSAANGLEFLYRGDPVAYVRSSDLFIEKAEMRGSQKIGHWKWQERANGNLGLAWEE